MHHFPKRHYFIESTSNSTQPKECFISFQYVALSIYPSNGIQRYKIYFNFMFKQTPEEFSFCFDQDHIRQGKALDRVQQWGGLEGLEKSLNTSIKKGRCDSEEVENQRVRIYGRNDPIVKPGKSLWQMILDNFEDDMLKILCVASVVSLILGIATEGLQTGWYEGTSILVAVIIIVTVTSGNNYIKQQQFKKLNEVAERKYVNVIRNGDVKNVSVYDLIVGDIQLVETGEIISVDGLVVESHNIIADESAMTGEPDGIRKFPPGSNNNQNKKGNNFLISGSKVNEGTGAMLVLATGTNSQYGKLKQVLQKQQEQTPLQQKLTILADQIGHVGMVSAAATFICMLGHVLYGAYASGDFMGHLLTLNTFNELVEAFIIAVSIIVVAVPEGLPLAVTIALAYSVGKMKDQNNLVRYLQACETMGGADNICSDKTGTLTRNVMAVKKMFVKEQTITDIKKGCLDEQTAWLLSVSCCQNSNANPEFTLRDDGSVERSNQIGNKTQCALLEMAYNLGFNYRQYRNKDNIIKVYPFSSETKSMTTVAKEKGRFYAFTKGAPDFVLKRCSSFLDSQGKPSPINDNFKNTLNGKITEFADQTFRTLLLAYREVEGCEENQKVENIAKDLIVIGLVGIKDPLRDQIPHAVEQCHEAGVTVRMITGDNPQTAVAIAKEAGILPENWKKQQGDLTVMTGAEFRDYVGGLINPGQNDQTVGNMQKFKQVAKQLKVLARSSPTDKYLMATGLKRLDHVVAMTGDGTNDAPALKKADIGFAMGITGTQIAKEASGIILLDDNFKSIVTAMKWGRNIFDSIRKFLQFQLTVNMVALVMAFSGAAILKESPLNPIQMLWVNLIMDTLASLALATEPPSDELLKRKPYSRFESLITADMWKNIITQGILQIFILGTILFKGPEIFGIQSSIGVKHNEWNEQSGKHYSMFFNVFVLLQIFNEVNARKLKSSELNVFKNFFNNPLFLIILILTLIVQMTCIEFGGQSLKTVPLSQQEHLICLGLGSLSIFAGFLFKLLVPASLFSFLSKSSKNKQE